MPGREARRDNLKRIGKWEEFVVERDRRRALRNEELRIAWTDELQAVLDEHGQKVLPSVFEYMVDRLVEGDRRPSRAGVMEGMSGDTGQAPVGQLRP